MASRRNYVTTAEVDEMIGSGASTDNQISEAEEIIDAYVGPQNRFYEQKMDGRAAAGGASQITLETSQQNVFDQDYFKYCEVEIVAGTGAGQRRTISGSTKEGVLTVATAFTTPPDATSVYRIYQLGKFPRQQDVVYYSTTTPYIYGKQIPEAVKRAVAAQVEFAVAMGDNFFKTDKTSMQSERIGDYSYSKGGSNSSGINELAALIAPKAKAFLKGIFNRTGTILV